MVSGSGVGGPITLFVACQLNGGVPTEGRFAGLGLPSLPATREVNLHRTFPFFSRQAQVVVAGSSLVRCKSAHIRQSYVDFFFIFLFFICPENDWVQICFKVIVCNVRCEIDDRVADRIKSRASKFASCLLSCVSTTVTNLSLEPPSCLAPSSTSALGHQGLTPPPPPPFTPPPRQAPSPLPAQGSSPWVSLASGGPGRAVQGRCADGVKRRRVAQQSR